MKYLSLIPSQKSVSILNRNFSISCSLLARRPPKEEYENNQFHTRKKTADPFDRLDTKFRMVFCLFLIYFDQFRRWRWTAKMAEPYNVNGGHEDWTKMTITHRGVQTPGYYDPKTKEFFHVDEMVPEIIVPNLNNCEVVVLFFCCL